MGRASSDDAHSSAAAGHRLLRTPVAAGVLIAVLGLLATAAAARVAATDTREDVVAHLERIATDVDVQVNRRLEAAEAALLTMAAQVGTGTASSSEVQQVLSGTGVVEEVPGLLAMVHAEASTTADGPRVAPTAIHPLTPNDSVLGRNLLEDPERRRAIEAARDTGDTATTSLVRHVDGDVAAILVVVPIHGGSPTSIQERRAAFEGVMMAVVTPDELLADVSRQPVAAVVEDLGPASVAPGPALPLTELWSSDDVLPADALTSRIRFADRVWRLTLAPAEGFPVSSNAAGIVAVAGVLLSGLLGLVASLLVGRRDRLERLVDERTRELRQANEQLERANRLRSQFITTVSHELRTPLTSVIGFIQTVRRLGTDNPAAREDFLARAERNGLMLRRMIEELLDFGRLERGEMLLDREPVDVAAAVTTMVRDVRPALGGRQLVLSTESDTWAVVDRDALERIVANMLSNAVQHAPGAGPIQLHVRQCDDWIEIACCDRGPGFREDDIPVLFERFVRGTGVMGEGTGIGLALVRELAAAHGGHAMLRNRDGGGAEVLVRLPARDVDAPRDEPVARADEPASQQRALSEVE